MTQIADVSAIIIISDLHVGAGPLDDFDPLIEEACVRFLRSLSTRATAVELVINGDFLEFVQAIPWDIVGLRSKTPSGIDLCYTEAQSVAKLSAICDFHPKVLQGLGDFLACEVGHFLTIVPGNHDADLFWPRVRTNLQQALDKAAGKSIGDRLQFVLQQTYHPLAAPSVWIEHGHQHDLCNRFCVDEVPHWSLDRPPISKDINNTPRIIECIGTRFLNKYLNRLDLTYPFVDNVKPFSRFVKLFGLSALDANYGPVPAVVALWAIAQYLASTAVSHRTDLLSFAEKNDASAIQIVRHSFNRLDSRDQAGFEAELSKRNISLPMPFAMLLQDDQFAERVLQLLSNNLEIAELLPERSNDLLSFDGDPDTLTLGRAYMGDETAELILAARSALNTGGASSVIMGHTHDMQDHPNDLSYVNTASWTRYLEAQTRISDNWALLKPNAVAQFPYKLSYAEIDPQRPESCRLVVWEQSHA